MDWKGKLAMISYIIVTNAVGVIAASGNALGILGVFCLSSAGIMTGLSIAFWNGPPTRCKGTAA